METFRQQGEGHPQRKPFDWKSSLPEETRRWFIDRRSEVVDMSEFEKIDEQLNSIAELAAEQEVDFQKLAEEERRKIGEWEGDDVEPNLSFSKSQALKAATPVNKMIGWGVKNGVIKQEEAENLYMTFRPR